MRFILASGSPRRRELLAQLGIDFTVIKPAVDEVRRAGEAPLAYVQRLSIEKAEAVTAQIDPPATVLAADTIGIEEDGVILEKPVDADHARAMLRRLRTGPHRVCTAFTLLRVGGRPLTETVCTTVYMRDYSDAEIDAYIASGDPFDKAGAYAIQNADFDPVARIEGSYTNVMGLPVEALRGALLALGWPL